MEHGNMDNVSSEADQSQSAAEETAGELDYEAEEARQQQERLNYLQQQKHLVEDDEVVARRYQNEELLQIQRQKIQQELTDEKLAREIQQHEQQSTRITTSEHRLLSLSEGADHRTNSADVNHLDGDLSVLDQQDTSGGVTEEYDGVLFLGDEPDDNELRTDEQLAHALQQQEEEDALFVARGYTAENQDAYLARIMQQTEQISAMRRNLNGQNVQFTSPPVSPQRTDFTATAQRTGATSQAVGQYQASSHWPQQAEVGGSEEPSAHDGDEAALSPATRQRRRRKVSKRASCKQQ